MATNTNNDLLRPRLLDGRVVAVAGASGELGGAVAAELRALGAEVRDEGDDALVCDAGAWLEDGFGAAVARVWDAASVVGNADNTRGSKIILIAPRAGGKEAAAVAGALESLARTLSVEWARWGITATAIAPGPHCSAAEVAALVSFLVSRGGDYYSGCVLELR